MDEQVICSNCESSFTHGVEGSGEDVFTGEHTCLKCMTELLRNLSERMILIGKIEQSRN